MYDNNSISKAFDIYKLLARDGGAAKDVLQEYMANDQVRGLVDQFAHKVDCAVIIAGDQLLMIPLTKLSPFHVSNDYLKKTYLRSSATNADLYLVYFCTLVLIGQFYNSFHTVEATRDFIQLDEWVQCVNERMEMLKAHSEEELKALEKEFSYNWTALIEKWDGMDDLKETARKQTGNTISRLSFVDTVKRFLIDQHIVLELGNSEIALTEKAKTIVQRFFMEVDFNRGILEFLFQLQPEKAGEEENALHF